MEEQRNIYTIYHNKELGKVRITDDVIATIAGVAATDVEGVASLLGGITRELILKTGVKKLAKSVNAKIVDEEVVVNIAINLDYGYSVIDISKDVQDKIKMQIEGMTGLTVSAVNVKVASVNVPNE